MGRALVAAAEHGQPVRIVTPGAEAASFVAEVLTRARRLAPRRNIASSSPWFDRVLAAHRALHDLWKLLVRADLDHALDAWQSPLRLDPAADALHDVERLVREPETRIEQHAADNQTFKDAHARAGAHLAAALFERTQVPEEISAAATQLIAAHERPGEGLAIRTFDDADALSLFSLNRTGYLACFGAQQAANKVGYTLARWPRRARQEPGPRRLPRVIRGFIDHAVHRARVAEPR